MNEWMQNEKLILEEWVNDIVKDGWCWFEDEKPHPHLWNKFTNATSSIGNMLIRATKAGLDKNTVKMGPEYQYYVLAYVLILLSEHNPLNFRNPIFV